MWAERENLEGRSGFDEIFQFFNKRIHNVNSQTIVIL